MILNEYEVPTKVTGNLVLVSYLYKKKLWMYLPTSTALIFDNLCFLEIDIAVVLDFCLFVQVVDEIASVADSH